MSTQENNTKFVQIIVTIYYLKSLWMKCLKLVQAWYWLSDLVTVALSFQYFAHKFPRIGKQMIVC